MRPTAASDRPPSNSRIARRRRRSNSAAVPCGRMHAVYTTADDLSITYAILNKDKTGFNSGLQKCSLDDHLCSS
jgi:hypothetical protein